MNKLSTEIKEVVNLKDVQATNDVKKHFLEGLKSEKLTRDEDPVTHFCVYFAGFDPQTDKVFIGHHKKSGLWLFNGGHIDEKENTQQALRREIKEEWGEVVLQEDSLAKPELLTITKIDNPPQTCRTHFDVWYFVWVHEDTFKPDKNLLDTEFYETKWLTIPEAKKIVTDPATLVALSYLNK